MGVHDGHQTVHLTADSLRLPWIRAGLWGKSLVQFSEPVEDAGDEVVIFAEFVQQGCQFGVVAGQLRERTVVLAGVVPFQRAAEGQAVGLQFAGRPAC